MEDLTSMEEVYAELGFTTRFGCNHGAYFCEADRQLYLSNSADSEILRHPQPLSPTSQKFLSAPAVLATAEDKDESIFARAPPTFNPRSVSFVATQIASILTSQPLEPAAVYSRHMAPSLVYRPHLHGPRDLWEKRNGLAPGQSSVRGSPAIKIESGVLSDISSSNNVSSARQDNNYGAAQSTTPAPANQSENVPLDGWTEIPAPRVQAESPAPVDTDPVRMNFFGSERPTPSATPRVIKQENPDDWDVMVPWEASPARQRNSAAVKIKQEPHTSDVIVTTTRIEVEQSSEVLPKSAGGLATSRFASVPPRSAPPVIDQFAKKLADPTAFMNAAGKRNASAQAGPIPSSHSRQSHAPPAFENNLVVPKTRDANIGNGAKTITTTSTKHTEGQSWPNFPKAAPGQNTRWMPAENQLNSASDSVPEVTPPHPNSEWNTSQSAASVNKFEVAKQAKSAWNDFASTESKHQVTAPSRATSFRHQSITFVPAKQQLYVPPHRKEQSATKETAHTREPPKLVDSAAWSYPVPEPQQSQATSSSTSTITQVQVQQAQRVPATPSSFENRGAAPAVHADRINDMPLSEVVNTDRIAFKNLQVHFDAQGVELETNKQELAAYKEERSGVDRELELLRAKAESTKDIEAKYNKLKAEHEALLKQLGDPSSKSGVPAAAQLEWLTTRNKELEFEISTKQPLFEIGRDVRAVFLEEARVKLLQLKRSDMDKSVTEKGHIAMYHANGKVDTALMIGGHLTNAQIRNYQQTFEKLYSEHPDYCASVGNKMQAGMDAYGTIMTSFASTSAHPSRPRKEMEDVKTLVTSMAGERNKLVAAKGIEIASKEFEEDAGGHAARHLELIREAMIPVVTFERKWRRLAINEQIKNDATAKPFVQYDAAGKPISK